MKQNNKGQVLVLFLLLIPFILIFISLIIDYGTILINKKSLNLTIDEILKDAIDNNLTKEQINYLITKNIDDITYKEIKMEDKKITIHITKKINGGFINIIKKDLYEIDINKTMNKKEW